MDERSLGPSGKRSTYWSESLIINEPRAVIFDFDGTLAKTMEDNFKAWKSAMSDYGIDLQPEDYYPLEGMSVFELPKALFGKYRRTPPDEKEVIQKKENHYFKHHRFSLYPGAEELLKLLRAKQIPIALVTAALKSRLDHSLPAGFLKKFDAVVTCDDTPVGKPSPLPYLKGAQKLGIEPDHCIAVENAPLGVQSAKKAGTYCIAVSNTVDKKYLNEADEVWDSIQDLKKSQKIRQLFQ